ncbi:MAG: hypothetical protein ABI629_21045 [bacterium]
MSEESPTYAGALRPIGSDLDLTPRLVTTAAEMKHRLEELQAFVNDVMREGVHYGPPYPGSDKRMLYKAGAELLAEIYAYTVKPRVTHRIEIWDPPQGPFFHYEFEADVSSKRSGMTVGSGFGSCNSRENRYRWRNGGRVCPLCEKENTIIKGKQEFGGGWLCFGKKGGCGEKFQTDDPRIADQELGRVENDDVCTLVNTILQVAKKRCFVAAVISVTQSSGLFESGEDEDAADTPGGKKGGGGRKGDGRRGANNPRAGSTSTGSSGASANAASNTPPDDKHTTKVTVRGEVHWTSGVEFKSLLRVWDLSRGYDDRFGKDGHRKFMKSVVGVESSHDLNEEMAEKVIAGLMAEIERVGDVKPGEAAAPAVYDS